MFVRWKRRTLEGSFNRGKVVKYAVLVESYRNDAGQPRQRFIAHLGSILTDYSGMEFHQWFFWQKVSDKLDKLSLTEDQQKGIEASLELKVPYPQAEDRLNQRYRFDELASDSPDL